MNRSEISNEFNFDNQLDITQNRRDKDQYFSKSGFAFEDFMNIGDRTNKSIDKMSSKHPNNTSEIFRKEQDSALQPGNNNIIDYLTQHSIKRKKDPSLLESLSQTNPPELLALNQAVSPKFGDEIIINTTKSIQDFSRKEFTLRRTETLPFEQRERMAMMGNMGNAATMQANRSVKTPQNISSAHSPSASNAFKKKEAVYTQQQEEYRQLQNQIRFYQGSLERMIYQSHRMQDQTENLLSSFNSAVHEAELEVYAKQIKAINVQIEEQRNLQAQLTRVMGQLEEEYEQLVNSVKTSNFPRPVKMKDEAKAIVDEINALKAEFQALERDGGSLNLSSTLLNNPSAFQPGNTFRRPSKPESAVVLSKIQEIHAENKRTEDPRFLFNIKMACLRDEWSLYANSDIQAQVSYRHCPHIRLTLGNKLTKDLQRFSLSIDGSPKLQGETVAARSYLVHEIDVNEESIEELFIKCDLSYMIDGSKRTLTLFVPTGITTFGQFSPITEKEFIMDAGKEQFQFCSGFRPLDKKLLANITEVDYYMSNLLIDRENFKCCGMFISLFNAVTFLQIRQRGELISISSRTPDWALIRLLQFVFTI